MLQKETAIQKLDKIAISVKSHKLLKELLVENPRLEEIMRNSRNETEALVGVRNWVLDEMNLSKLALDYYEGRSRGFGVLKKLEWRDYASIRLLDYVDNAGREYPDLNLRGEIAVSNPVKMIWLAVNFGTGGAKPPFFKDMLQLFRQFRGEHTRKLPLREKIESWMNRFPSGIDPRIVKLREENRERIIKIIIKQIEDGEVVSERYRFDESMSQEQKFLKVLEWWNDPKFHLKFAVRTPALLNKMLGESLDPDTMKVLYEAEKAGIPFFVNPYYLSLLHVRVPYFAIGADLAIRDYIIYQKQLINEFGKIRAWEKEDAVKPGEPNAAGWLLPSHNNVHRRYPEVAILIPDTVGRACGGLCTSCQRMFDFQSGHLNFNLEKLKPNESWDQKLEKLMHYFETDSQLRDILITGGDALMSSDKSLMKILNAVLAMAERKRNANKIRKNGEKFAEIVRVRLGTRLPVYLPQRIDEGLCEILSDFKKNASKIGIKQFVIQTHFESPMEITPEAKNAISRMLKSGWFVTNQLVFTAAASRRGHTVKLRKDLNDIGVLSYYTFTVKGYMENNHNFAVNARSLQEQIEEKSLGIIPSKYFEIIRDFPLQTSSICEGINAIREGENIPFLATDRNVLNLPGVGKSMTFRVVGITRYGRRILEFEHDGTRVHSPILDSLEKVTIIESKSVSEYLEQLEQMGEEISDYDGLYGYSIGETENRLPVYEYPEYNYKITDEFTNLHI
jgi:lysine 2,3-aminomutase